MARDSVRLGQAFQLGLLEEMERDDRIIVIGTDLFRRGGHFAQVYGLGDRFGPERVRDAPISEAAMVAAGVGAAMNGLRPVIDLNFLDFSLGAADEIINQAAKMRYMSGGAGVPLVIRASNGVAGYAAQHNNSLEAVFASTPGLFVVMPTTPADTKGLIKAAVRSDDPVVFLMHKRLGAVRGSVGDADDVIPLGQAAVRREGRDVSLVSYGDAVRKCLEAAELLAGEGLEAEVIDLRSLAPLDIAAIGVSAAKTGRAFAVSEAPSFGSFASELAASIQERCWDELDAPVGRISGVHAPIPHNLELVESMIPQSDDIVRTVLNSFKRWPRKKVMA